MRTMVAIFICFGAILFIFSESFLSDSDASGESEQFSAESQMFGNAMAFGCAIGSAAYYTALRYVTLHETPVGVNLDLLPINAMSCIISCIVSLFLSNNGVTRQDPDGSYMATGQSEIVFLFLQGCVSLPVSFTLIANASKNLISAEIGMLMTIETVLGPTLVALAGYDQPPAMTIYAGVIIIATLFSHEFFGLQEAKRLKLEIVGLEGVDVDAKGSDNLEDLEDLEKAKLSGSTLETEEVDYDGHYTVPVEGSKELKEMTEVGGINIKEIELKSN